MQSIYKPGGADTRETWFSIATFCIFRPFSLFGSDFQLFKLSCSNSKFCFYPALACLNIQATSNISKIWLIPFVQRVRNLCLLSSLLTLNLKNELEIFNTWFTVLLGISSSRSPRTAWLLSSVGDYVPCQKFAPAKTYRLWPGKFVNYSLLLSLIITKAHLRLCNMGSSPRGSWVSVILCGTSQIGSQYLIIIIALKIIIAITIIIYKPFVSRASWLDQPCHLSPTQCHPPSSPNVIIVINLIAKTERDWHQRVSILWNSVVL